MNPSAEMTNHMQSVESTRLDGKSEESSSQPPSVIIIVPPWPRSGAARVMKNQIDYYRARGFQTVLVVVPFHRAFMQSSPIWQGITEGIQELGADQLFVAPLEPNRYSSAKYTSSLRHAFRGTALDWEFAIANSARLPNDLVQFLRGNCVSLLHVNYVQTLGFAARLRKKLASTRDKVPVILETHDVQAHLLHDRRELNPWTRKPDALKRLIDSEISLLRRVDVLIHLSEDDFRFFRSAMPRKFHVLALPVIDETYVTDSHAAAPVEGVIDLLFVGQNHAPNVAAMEWFLEDVWPLIAEHHYNLKVVGPVGTSIKESLPRLFEAFQPCFVGPVENLASYYNSARCVIAPMVSGSGTSIKTIEALALGKPFVGTSKAFRGMPIERMKEAGIEAHDTPRGFVAAVAQTLSDVKQAGLRSRAAYERVFSKEANFAARDEAFRVAASHRK